MNDLNVDASTRRRRRMADVSVSEAAAAWADGANVFLTRIGADLIEAVEQVGWRLEHIAEGTRPAVGADSPSVFCLFVRPAVS